MGVRVTTEVFAICQSKEVLISPGKSQIPRLYCLHQDIQIEEKQIKIVYNWPKP